MRQWLMGLIACFFWCMALHAADVAPPTEAAVELAKRYQGHVVPTSLKEFLKTRPTYEAYSFDKLHFNEKIKIDIVSADQIYISKTDSLVKLVLAKKDRIVAFYYAFADDSDPYSKEDVGLVLQAMFPKERYTIDSGGSQGSFFPGMQWQYLIYDTKLVAQWDSERKSPALEKLVP